MKRIINVFVQILSVSLLLPLSSCLFGIFGLIGPDSDDDSVSIPICIINNSDTQVTATFFGCSTSKLFRDYFDYPPDAELPAKDILTESIQVNDDGYIQCYFKQDSIAKDRFGEDSLRYIIMRYAIYDYQSFKDRRYKVSYPDDCVTDSIIVSPI